MRAARHHIVNYSGDRAVIPGHEEAGDEERADDDVFFFGDDGPEDEGRSDEKAGSYRKDAAEGEAFLQQVGDEAAGEHAE